MRFIVLGFFLLVVLRLTAQNITSIPFIWLDSELNGEHFEKTSMHIPVKFHQDSIIYYFQFDTGAHKSYIYTKGNPDSKLMEQCTSGDSILSDIGPLLLIPRQSNSVFTENGKTFIGTIGADFLTNKIIEVNFPEQQIYIIESYDKSNYELISCKGSWKRPIITIQIEDKSYNFMYDTGSSLFDLLTSHRLWKKWKMPNAHIQEFPLSSWGKIIIASRTKLNSPIAIAKNSSSLLTQVWYKSNKTFSLEFKRTKVSGIIGNKPFLDQTLLIDLNNRRIGIKKAHNKAFMQ